LLTKRIIPCLDVDRGRVVKGYKFFDHVDAGDPVEQASAISRMERTNWSFMTSPPAMRGGISWPIWSLKWSNSASCPVRRRGIRTLEDATRLIQAGAEKVSVNSAAVQNPRLITEIARKFGSQAAVLGLDANRVQRDGTEHWEVFINGGRVNTGIKVMDWVEQAQSLGAGEIVLNVMNADGTKEGYDVE